MELAGAATAEPITEVSEAGLDALVEQARGVLMARRDCSAAGALAVLQASAHDSGTTVRAVAAALVDEVEARARHRRDAPLAPRTRVSRGRTPGR